MTIDAFIKMTEGIIAKDGLDGYLPTLILPKKPAVLALQGVPEGIDVEKASREWMAKKVGDSLDDFYLAFRSGANAFKVVTRIAGVPEERVVQFGAG